MFAVGGCIERGLFIYVEGEAVSAASRPTESKLLLCYLATKLYEHFVSKGVQKQNLSVIEE